MKNYLLFAIVLGLTLDGCGGGLELTMKPGKGFKVKSTVEVESDGFDPVNLQHTIERALFKNGVNIQSASLAPTGSAPQQDLMSQGASPSTGKKTDSVSTGLSTVKGAVENSVYLLTFAYKSNYTFSGEMITDFSATVFKAGEIVGMISYHGAGMPVEQLAENVGKDLAQKLK